jgi:hypothetical protein
MRFVLAIDLGNDAMVNGKDVREAILNSRAMAGYDEAYKAGEAGAIRDRNGNRVGSWHVEE